MDCQHAKLPVKRPLPMMHEIDDAGNEEGDGVDVVAMSGIDSRMVQVIDSVINMITVLRR